MWFLMMVVLYCSCKFAVIVGTDELSWPEGSLIFCIFVLINIYTSPCPDLWSVILLCVLWASWSWFGVWCYKSLIASNISVPFFLVFLAFYYVYVTPLVTVPQFLDILLLLFFPLPVSFLLFSRFSYRNFCWHILTLRNYFLSSIQSAEFIKSILIYVVFGLCHVLLIFHVIFICLHCPSVFKCSLVFSLGPLPYYS